jgi:hypothetical protein
MNMENFVFYDCCLEGRQLKLGESGFLAASEVVQSIFGAGFRKNGLNWFDFGTNALFECKYVSEPKDGMFLMEVRNHTGDIGNLVFVDTRTKPNYVWVQTADYEEDNGLSLQVARLVEEWIAREAYAYGWNAKLKRSVFDKLVYVAQFDSAMAYIKEYLERIPPFASYVIYEEKTEEIIKKLHLMIDGKVSGMAIMRVIRAAIDTGLIDKPCYKSLVMEFGKRHCVSYATYKGYTNMKQDPFAGDGVYREYVDMFMILKDKWLDEMAAK